MPPSKIEPKTELGRRLLAFIIAKGLKNPTAAAVAKPEVHKQQLYGLLYGKDPRVSTLERIVHALGGTMHEFYDPALLEENNPTGKLSD